MLDCKLFRVAAALAGLIADRGSQLCGTERKGNHPGIGNSDSRSIQFRSVRSSGRQWTGIPLRRRARRGAAGGGGS